MHGNSKKDGSEAIYCVVPTYHRDEYLERFIEACLLQSRPVDRIVVIDNGRSESAKSLCDSYPEVEYIRATGNIGPWAAHAVGMRFAVNSGADFIWNSDDDSAPVCDALETLLMAIRNNSKCGAIGSGGGEFSLYPKHWKRGSASGPVIDKELGIRSAGFIELDGTLWRAEVIRNVGTPREDYFMGMGGMEFSYRVLKSGFKLGLIDRELTSRLHLGSGGTGAPGAPWRSYYQTRNHLAMAIRFRSPKLLFGWALRQVRIVTGSMLYGKENRFELLIWRLRGTRDALLGRMGNRVDPTTYHKSKYI